MGYGGALIWTGLARNLKKEFPSKKIIFLYSKPIKHILFNIKNNDHSIYKNNDDISLVINKFKWVFMRYKFNKEDIIIVDMNDPSYIYCEKDTAEKIYYKTGKHAIQIACDVHGIKNALLKPKIVLDREENNKVENLLKTFRLKDKKYICVEPHAKLNFTPNKAWFWDRWQQLMDNLNRYFSENNLDIQLVQIGLSTDKVLNGVLDLTGHTTFRETAGLLKNSLFLIGYMGGLIHLSKAVGNKNIVLLSPWEPKELASYHDDVNIYPEIECKNCGLKIPCPKERECMKKITVWEVDRACRTLIKKIISRNEK